MTYDAAEQSIDYGSPITLYEFTVGDGPNDVLRYTDADEDVFHDGFRWSQQTVKRSKINADGNLNKQDLKINLPQDCEIVALYVSYPPSYVVTVRIFEGHFSDIDREFINPFNGRLLNVQIQGVEAELTCQPASTSLKRLGLRRHYQRGCPLLLYGPDCRATKTAVNCVTVSSEGNVIVGEPEGGSLPLGADPYAGGIIQWTDSVTGRTEIRSLLSASVDGAEATFQLSGPVNNAPMSFQVFKGCNHTEAACANWHNNINNYGGQPWIPLKNPIGTTSTFF